ncbi:MAG: hypothetical protein M5U34_14415 [Chloroflexi bacterium]|nr:hypothetical protein [Chloroflexota bacterium]
MKTEIRYSVGVISGGNFVPDPNWNYIKLSPEGITQATLPLISISNNKVQIAYTNLGHWSSKISILLLYAALQRLQQRSFCFCYQLCQREWQRSL